MDLRRQARFFEADGGSSNRDGSQRGGGGGGGSGKLDEQNEGYKMLKGMGWQEGSGLGLQGTGIAAPVKADGQLTKVGVGLNRASAAQDVNKDLGDAFSSYRAQRASGFLDRMQGRAGHRGN